MMVTNKTLVHGTDKDPRLTIRAGAVLIHASEDNVDRIMTDLEQSRKNAAQLKETLIKERDDIHIILDIFLIQIYDFHLVHMIDGLWIFTSYMWI